MKAPNSRDDPQSLARKRFGCLPIGVCVAVASFVVSIIICCGIGSPNTYRHHIGRVQVFEGPDRVVLFVEIERDMRWPGSMPRPPHNYAAAFYRIDIFPDGRVRRKKLEFDLDDRITLNTNLYAVTRLQDGFYLVENPSYAPRPAYWLGPDRIERLNFDEAMKVWGTDGPKAGDDFFDLSQLDALSIAGGWRRLNHDQGGGPYLLLSDRIESPRNNVALRHVGGFLDEREPESIVAQSLRPADHWEQTLIEVDTTPWTSYKSPSDHSYLRAKAADLPTP